MNVEYAAIHGKVFEKLEKVWDLRKSRVAAEVFFRHTGKQLIGPHRIRWLKTYDAVSTHVLCSYFFFVCKYSEN